MVTTRRMKKHWRDARMNARRKRIEHEERSTSREVVVKFAIGLSKRPTVREAVIALDAGEGAYTGGMHFGFDDAEYVVALFTDADGSDYALVGEWSGSSLRAVKDEDWGYQLLNLAGQIARRASAS